jgi:cytochrome o ubiquinol oxidase operon protein cyoD
MNHLSLKSYIVGFGLSLLLTLVPYALVSFELAPRSVLVPAVVLAAILQLFVQLGFFLHLRHQCACFLLLLFQRIPY